MCYLSAPVCASKREVAIASTSSMKMMAGAFSLAILNTSRTIRGPCKANSRCSSLTAALQNKLGLVRSMLTCNHPRPLFEYCSRALSGRMQYRMPSALCMLLVGSKLEELYVHSLLRRSTKNDDTGRTDKSKTSVALSTGVRPITVNIDNKTDADPCLPTVHGTAGAGGKTAAMCNGD